ncbi:prepilin-type N-terminal cleavage/methylation domain-containing protein [Bacillus thuringiensis]|uniref:prepilin-type N-terminal cleavage/methylation domain-containing protein n=1 Tax=Bacillus thuringiensis TaxID=1428 RepID=UPI0021D691C9|nr:prepilin-type N-terminal cleavage/methylation domain-containing protein [Bacillus thuringiensis]MCU7667433.1 prepilin-type N-terminal cleavage/methylation domain-containing protein [Bacillus thuringiensis]
MFRREEGFTLYEVLIVIVIIGILLLVLLPNLNTATVLAREKGIQKDLVTYKNSISGYIGEIGNAEFSLGGINGYLDAAMKFENVGGKLLSKGTDSYGNHYELKIYSDYLVVTTPGSGNGKGQILGVYRKKGKLDYCYSGFQSNLANKDVVEFELDGTGECGDSMIDSDVVIPPPPPITTTPPPPPITIPTNDKVVSNIRNSYALDGHKINFDVPFGVTKVNVYKEGSLLGSTTGNYFIDTTSLPGEIHEFSFVTVDSTENMGPDVSKILVVPKTIELTEHTVDDVSVSYDNRGAVYIDGKMYKLGFKSVLKSDGVVRYMTSKSPSQYFFVDFIVTTPSSITTLQAINEQGEVYKSTTDSFITTLGNSNFTFHEVSTSTNGLQQKNGTTYGSVNGGNYAKLGAFPTGIQFDWDTNVTGQGIIRNDQTLQLWGNCLPAIGNCSALPGVASWNHIVRLDISSGSIMAIDNTGKLYHAAFSGSYISNRNSFVSSITKPVAKANAYGGDIFVLYEDGTMDMSRTGNGFDGILSWRNIADFYVYGAGQIMALKTDGTIIALGNPSFLSNLNS